MRHNKGKSSITDSYCRKFFWWKLWFFKNTFSIYWWYHGQGWTKKLENKDFGDEKFMVASECLYMYLPRNATPKRLNTNYLEKQLSITMTMTMRKLNIVEHLVKLCKK